MSFKITKGKVKKNELCLIMGVDGVGKSTFGSEAPNPIFIPVEDGSNSLDVARFPRPKNYDEVLQMLSHPMEYETIVFDSLDHFEPMVWEKTVQMNPQNNVKTIEDYGYGKGYILADKYWQEFFRTLEKAREKAHIVLIAHSKIKVINDPLQPAPYDKHVIKLQDRAKAIIKETVDTILFANFEIYIKQDKSNQKGKAFGEGRRFLYTHEMPGHEAKNRDGLPYQIPMEKGKMWSAYMGCKSVAKESPETIRGQIEGIAAVLVPDVQGKILGALQKAGDNVQELNRILNKALTIQGVKNAS